MTLRRRAVLAVLVALTSAAASCSGGGPDGQQADPEALPGTTAPPSGDCGVVAIGVAEALPDGVDAGTPPTLPAGVDTGYVGSGPGSGNPYLVPGARQVPGPDMTVTTLGPEPSTVAVAVPPNPDVGSPPALTPGVTTPPTPPTTLPTVEVTTTTAASATTTTALMALADDPGCVALPGDP